MELKVEIDRNDFVEFNKYFFFKTIFKRSLIIAFLFIILTVSFLHFDRPFNFDSFFTDLVILISMWGSILFVFYKLHIFRVKKMPDKDGSILGEKMYFFRGTDIKEITKECETTLKWSGIKSVEENEDYFFILVDKIAAYVIPKRFFKDKNEENKFIDIINTKIKNYKNEPKRIYSR